ncbi:MAG: ABC transporter ATP-binding protein [Firmicutes bacterium]|nr:ABC transporter ATP-binding protein [Bacillota bacterium]
MTNNIIIFECVSKSYKIYKNKPTTLKEYLLNKIHRRNKLKVLEHKVLDNVSFVINQGETVGIIGVNGAGKSTTLKLIANIIPPDYGNIEINGSVSSLLEIGAGFQSDLTGKENVYLYGSILGLSKKIIDDNYKSIVGFSELEDFMDTAVKNYSSGMYMRLAFSVAIHVDPDILLIDEVMAVGDANFQKKCLAKIHEFRNKGKTIIFVSHDMSLVRQLCDRVLFIDKGGKVYDGNTDQLVNLYFAKLYGSDEKISIESNKTEQLDLQNIHAFKKQFNDKNYNNTNCVWGSKEIVVERGYFSNNEGYITNTYYAKEDIVMNLDLFAKNWYKDIVIGIAIYDENGNHLSGPNSKIDGLVIKKITGKKNVKIVFKKPPFLQGIYYVTIAVYNYECSKPFIHLEKYYKFNIINKREEYGSISLDCEWLL